MKRGKEKAVSASRTVRVQPEQGKAEAVLCAKIGDSVDLLVEYLVDNDVTGIHPLIMGEIEKRLIIKVLERSRGNKLRAAKLLGIGRNTFHRKIRLIGELGGLSRYANGS